MPNYDFSCETCGVFEQHLRLDEVSGSTLCPTCGESALRVYSMPGVIATSGTQKKARLLNEKGAEPKVVRKPADGGANPKPVRVGGRPWQINH